MNSGIGAKQLIDMYNISSSTFHAYLAPHRDKLRELGTKRLDVNGNEVLARNYNPRQLKFIVETIFGDSPEGYEFDGRILKKLSH